VLPGSPDGRAWREARQARELRHALAQPAAVTTALDVAEVVWRAANDVTGQLRFPAGPDAMSLAQFR